MKLSLGRAPSAAVLGAVLVGALLSAAPASAELGGSRTDRVRMGYVSAGGSQTCAVLSNGHVRCWGSSQHGKTGLKTLEDIGDDELPNSVDTLKLGGTPLAVSAGDANSCAILANGRAMCWGDGSYGRLGYGNTDDIGDNEHPSAAGAIDLGKGRKVRAISAGYYHTCALLDNGRVRCFGWGGAGSMGLGNLDNIGDDEKPGSVPPVKLGGKAVAIDAAGAEHTCAILRNGSVRCWGEGGNGRLGYGSSEDIGDNETPDSVGPVAIGANRKARAIAVGFNHSCALLDNGKVRCWGAAYAGQLGYGNTTFIGDDEPADAVGFVPLGAGRKATAITAGNDHTCALLDNARVRCWGDNGAGQLGYGNGEWIGDNEPADEAGPVKLGAKAVAVEAGANHTCALLDTGRLRCWGGSESGQLGYGNKDAIGDNESPDAAGPVALGRKIDRKPKTRLSSGRKPASDPTPPHTFRVKGALKGRFVPDDITCRGKVKIVATRSGQMIASTRARLRAGKLHCTFAKKLQVGRVGSFEIKARYPGSSNLRPAKSRRLTASTF